MEILIPTRQGFINHGQTKLCPSPRPFDRSKASELLPLGMAANGDAQPTSKVGGMRQSMEKRVKNHLNAILFFCLF